MINKQLLSPSGIVVVGGSNNFHKPGGRILQNILAGGFTGNLFVVNPKDRIVQGLPSLADINELPPVDLAILAIGAAQCVSIVRLLAEKKGTKAFIILSAGFSEDSAEGRILEKQIVDIVDEHNGCLIGPNCIGVVTQQYRGVFTTPVPRLSAMGCDFASGSGATAVFIIESALPKGLTFASVFSVGNSAQTGIEEIVEYWDLNYEEGVSPATKLLYIENIRDPDKLLHHASSLIRKGCRIAAIKAGSTEAGSRAATSHTGAMASSDLAVEALFRKAGIVRCFGREELTTVACVFTHKSFRGKNIAIVTHAGGPAVMLTDALSSGGLNIPRITGEDHERLLAMMNPGASADNPVDLIATATSDQLKGVIEYIDRNITTIDAMIVIFGSNGLIDIREIYELLHQKILDCSKPILPILPSVTSSHEELEYFMRLGHVNFPDEVVLARALTRISDTPYPAEEKIYLDHVDVPRIRKIIEQASDGYLAPDEIQHLLSAASIPMVKEGTAATIKQLMKLARETGYPLALKVIGPVHKSDVGGVTLNIKSDAHLQAEFKRMMKIKDVTGVILQQMLSGIELFIGANYEPRFGHIILCGLGGIFVEVLGDISSGLAPLTFDEARSMIGSLRSYRIIHGTRGKPGINEARFAEIIVRLSSLLRYATEIKEIDLNPLLGNADDITVVDARIRIEKTKPL
jgi:acetate---CoA ligase (ADP-forming)